MPPTVLLVVRYIRTFNLTDSCRRHPFLWYSATCGVLVSWANYSQYRRLQPMFPQYEKYCREEGGRMMDAKRQELADVNRYNSMVAAMRRDLNKT